MPQTPRKGLGFILCCFGVSLLGSRHYLRENRQHSKGREVLISINNDCSLHHGQLNITYKHHTGKYRFKLFYTTVFTCSCWEETVDFSQRKNGEGRRKSKLQGSLLKVLRQNMFLCVFCPLQTLHSQSFSYSLLFFLKCLFRLSGWKHKEAHKHEGSHKHRSKAAAERIPSQVRLHQRNWEKNLAHWLFLTSKVVTLILS